MADFTDEQLLDIIASGETDRVEFKSSLQGDAPKGIREAICAFANDLPNHEKPGLAFVGVEKDGTLLGETITEETILQLADMKTDGNIVPPPTLIVQKRILQGKEVAIVVVQPSDSTPVRFKGTIQVRIGPRRGIATAQDERILNEKRRYKDRPFDLFPIPDTSLVDLDFSRFENEYVVQAFAGDVITNNDRSQEERLAATKMIDSINNTMATVLGILVLGRNTQDFLPGAYIQFLRISGKEWGDSVIDDEEIRGALLDLLRRVDEKLVGHNRISVDILSDLVERREYTYPIEAIRQIILNAVMHRSYEGTNSPVRVYWYDDRIEVISPGDPFGEITVDNFGQPGLTDYRNPNLADAMKTLGLVQRYGYGITLSNRLLKESGHPDLEFRVENNFVRVVIKDKNYEEPR